MKVEWLEVGPSVRRLLREVPVDPRNCQTVEEFQGHVRVVFVAAQ